MADEAWFYADAGQQAGPVSLAELRQLLASGKVSAADLVWRQGMDNWAPAGSMSELSAPASPTVAPVPPIAPPILPPHAVQSPPIGYYAAESRQPIYAGFWLRVVAAIIDWFAVTFAFFVIALPLAFIAAMPPVQYGGLHSSMRMDGHDFVAICVFWLYSALMESSPTQATLGKMALGLRVTDENGNRISFGRATGRHFGKFISAMILGIGFLMAGLTARKQALHDMMAGCLVIRQ